MIVMLLAGLNLYAQESDAPDMALLEFIGESVKVDNQIVDPMTWQAMEKMTGGDQDKSQQGKTKQNGWQRVNRQQDNE